MLVIVGLIVVFGMVIGGFVLSGGKAEIIFHALPYEGMIIFGAAVGAFVISNSGGIIKSAATGVVKAIKGAKWKPEDYISLLSLLFVLIKTMRTKGVVAVESHIENPEESSIFQHFERISADHHIVDFICDYMRMMTMNFDDPHQMEDAMEKDLQRHYAETAESHHALQIMADGLPALGIVAAVLGVIKTMASIDAPTEILGKMIGGALTGTFLGIFLSYTMVAPVASRLGQIQSEEGQFLAVAKAVIISYLHGNAPQVAVEIGRRNVPTHLQPGFDELEDAISEIPPDL